MAIYGKFDLWSCKYNKPENTEAGQNVKVLFVLSGHTYHPGLCPDVGTDSETDLCILCRWSRHRSSLSHSHIHSDRGKETFLTMQKKNNKNTKNKQRVASAPSPPASSSDPSCGGPGWDRNRLRSSFWGRAGSRCSAAVLWRWCRCGRSAGRPRPCDELTRSLCGLQRGQTTASLTVIKTLPSLLLQCS